MRIHWRKATWALVIWTILIGLWLVTGIVGVSGMESCTGQYADACEAGRAAGAGIAVTFILMIWFIGFIVFGLIWLMSRPKENVTVYGPDGQRVVVTEKEAAKRVAHGWSYYPPQHQNPTE